ncbi:MAG TPA: hypothetical protein VFU22_12390, partial [Roseiflexaceae bacterium]|nr:hypothetical protein [Roseiflexaceae bacterium]
TTQITAVSSADLKSGLSGALVQRHTISYTSHAQQATTSLVTKVATQHEWRVLDYLNAQRQPNVPFAHAFEGTSDEDLLVCMQDVGDTTRPTSLEPISDQELEREALGLASIHAANFAQAAPLAWLPKVDRAYVEEMLFQRTWRPALERALASRAFVETFRGAVPRRERAHPLSRS